MKGLGDFRGSTRRIFLALGTPSGRERVWGGKRRPMAGGGRWESGPIR